MSTMKFLVRFEFIESVIARHSVHLSPLPPSFLLEGGGGELNLLPNFRKGMTWQDLNFERRVAEKDGGNFYQGVVIFTKN